MYLLSYAIVLNVCLFDAESFTSACIHLCLDESEQTNLWSAVPVEDNLSNWIEDKQLVELTVSTSAFGSLHNRYIGIPEASGWPGLLL